jgi:hypothetical protein
MARYACMSELLTDHGHAGGAWRLRSLARRARSLRLSGRALLATSIAFCVMSCMLLLWSGIVSGAPRAVLLLLVAGGLQLRLLTARLGALTASDGVAAPSGSAVLRRWSALWEEAIILLAAGVSAWAAHVNVGLLAGLVAAALLLATGWRRRHVHAIQIPSRPDATTVLSVVCLVALFEPLWGWHGVTMTIGLCAVCAVLVAQFLRPLPVATA